MAHSIFDLIPFTWSNTYGSPTKVQNMHKHTINSITEFKTVDWFCWCILVNTECYVPLITASKIGRLSCCDGSLHSSISDANDWHTTDRQRQVSSSWRADILGWLLQLKCYQLQIPNSQYKTVIDYVRFYLSINRWTMESGWQWLGDKTPNEISKSYNRGIGT